MRLIRLRTLPPILQKQDLQAIDKLKGVNMPKYSKKSQEEVKKAMHERKQGTLKSGKSNKKVTSKKQAIAIGLSKARKKAAKVPSKKKSSSSSRRSSK